MLRTTRSSSNHTEEDDRSLKKLRLFSAKPPNTSLKHLGRSNSSPATSRLKHYAINPPSTVTSAPKPSGWSVCPQMTVRRHPTNKGRWLWVTFSHFRLTPTFQFNRGPRYSSQCAVQVATIPVLPAVGTDTNARAWSVRYHRHIMHEHWNVEGN